MRGWTGLIVAGFIAGWPSLGATGCTDIGDPALMSPEIEVPSGPLTFERHIKPILLEAGCLGCHFSGGGGSGSLDASTPEGLAAGGASGRAALVECDHRKSYMWYRVRWCQMPFPGFPNCLDPSDVAIIARWIDQGGRAEYVEGLCPDAPLD